MFAVSIVIINPTCHDAFHCQQVKHLHCPCSSFGMEKLCDSREFLKTSLPRQRTIRFSSQTRVHTFEPAASKSSKSPITMSNQLYETFSNEEVSDVMMADAAQLFSENYGVWGERSPRPGVPVKMSAQRLRHQYLPREIASSYTRVLVDGVLAGNAFVCRWTYNKQMVCWITQLVVHKAYRERGLARGLLMSLKRDTDDIFGVISSHPAACMAAASSYGRGIERISVDFIRTHARDILEASPISYISNARVCGTLFGQSPTDMVSGVDTAFFVDHDEPLEALRYVREDLNWPLGDLPDGSEFLLLLPRLQRRSRSRSGPATVSQ